ncbi:MAG: hypothetical protein ACRD3V_22745, partial [Vicinamibacteria bacterium]
LRLTAPLGEDGRIVRIGLLRRNEMLPGSFEAALTAIIPAVPPFSMLASLLARLALAPGLASLALRSG